MSKKLKNQQVVQAFFSGRDATSHTWNLNSQAGRRYSYNLEIARQDQDGGFVIFDFTAGGGSFASQTTSQHVGLAKRSAPSKVTTIMRPDAASIAGLI